MANIVSPEEAEEFTRLYKEYAHATIKAAAALQSYGMDSQEFAYADMEAGKFQRRLKDIQENV